MSELQGGRCHFDKTLIFLMNFEGPTECRYDMRHVVAYVVAYVVLVRVLMSAFAGCRPSAVHALVGSGPLADLRSAANSGGGANHRSLQPSL
jgi:hypothetical protein